MTRNLQPTNQMKICFLCNMENEFIIYLLFPLIAKMLRILETNGENLEIVQVKGCGLRVWIVGGRICYTTIHERQQIKRK